MKALQHYSGLEKPECSCCGENILAFLTLDHVNNDGKELRKKHGAGTAYYNYVITSGFLDSCRVLCFNCNCGRSVNGGTCPHKDVVAYE